MAKGGLGAHTFGCVWDMDAAAAVEALAEQGFTRFEFIAMAPHLDPRRASPDAARTIRRALEAAHGEALALDLPSNDVNLASTSPDLVDFTIESYAAALRMAGEIGARWVVVLPGRRHMLLPPRDDRLLDVFRGALERLVPLAERSGVRLLIENHPQTLLPDAASIAAFLAREGHGLVDALYDLANGVAIGEDPGAALSALEPFLAMVHVSDTPAGQWRHDPIGTGAVDFDAARDALARLSFAGPVVAEIIAPDPVAQLVRARAALQARGWPV
ncbi:sugar phosphate isomerase/epimerase family protein [Alsobacter sp. SYSU BS001988]